MVVLERLTPDQRVAFVLHDGFAVPFGEIADVLGVSDAAARQLASRAAGRSRRHQRRSPTTSHDEVVGKLMAAMAAGDMEAVVRLLHPDVTFTGDSNRKAPTAARVIHGPDKVARFLFGLARRYGPNWLSRQPARAGQRRARRLYAGAPASDGYPEMKPRVRADGAGRKGLRDMGRREPGQVHRLAAGRSSVVAHGTRHASPELKPCSVMPSAVFILARMFSTPIW